MTKEEAVAAYRRIADELDALHSQAADHISRFDNNQQFEVYHWLRDVADRIEKEYPDPHYRGLLAGYRRD